jgi:hypothetical protein
MNLKEIVDNNKRYDIFENKNEMLKYCFSEVQNY